MLDGSIGEWVVGALRTAFVTWRKEEFELLTNRRIAKAVGKRVSHGRLKALAAFGVARARHCPACRRDVVGFFRYGSKSEWGCPECGASPRERLVHVLLDRGILTVEQGSSFLHCAPSEHRLVDRFSVIASEYLPADFDPKRYDLPGMQKIDLMEMSETKRFNRIYASHVMEHVPDDAIVLRNIRRALKPDGEAWLLVPIWGSPTEDGPPDLHPRERERRFGQWDHVRQYGLDFQDRIIAAGFSVEVIDCSSIPSSDAHRMGLDDRVFRARVLP